MAIPAWSAAPSRVNGHPDEIVGVVRQGFNGLDIAQPPAVFLPIAGTATDRTFVAEASRTTLSDGCRCSHACVHRSPKPRHRRDCCRSIGRCSSRRPPIRNSEVPRPPRGEQFLNGVLHVTSAAHGHSGLRQSVTEPLLILMSVAVGVLLIVCANVANLLIARGAARHRELAVRLAVGASRWQFVRLLLVESLVLAGVGTLLGLLFASWGAAALLHYYESPDTPLAIASDPDLRIAVFSGGLAILTAMLAGCVPALRSTRLDVAPALRSAEVRSRASSRGSARRWSSPRWRCHFCCSSAPGCLSGA